MEKMEGVRSLPEGVTSTINVLIDRALSGTSMVKSAEGILTLLRKEQVLLQLRLTPKMVGVHPRNRDGVGVAVREVHSLLADILDTGLVPSLVSALAFEVTGPEELEFNRKLIEPAGGQLGVADVAQMRYLSVCGSHTNFVLRLFVDSVEHSQNQQVTVNGRLSQDALRLADTAFFQAVQEGVVWEIIPSWIALQFPRLPEILQQVGNTSLNRGESEMQMLQRLHSMCVEHIKRGKGESRRGEAAGVGKQASFCCKLVRHVDLCHEVLRRRQGKHDARNPAVRDDKHQVNSAGCSFVEGTG